jgi:hypothetical protein
LAEGIRIDGARSHDNCWNVVIKPKHVRPMTQLAGVPKTVIFRTPTRISTVSFPVGWRHQNSWHQCYSSNRLNRAPFRHPGRVLNLRAKTVMYAMVRSPENFLPGRLLSSLAVRGPNIFILLVDSAVVPPSPSDPLTMLPRVQGKSLDMHWEFKLSLPGTQAPSGFARDTPNAKRLNREFPSPSLGVCSRIQPRQ